MEPNINPSDDELVLQIKTGKKLEEAVKSLYRAHFDSLTWYVVNNSGTRQDAEDNFQEVIISFINLVQKDKFRGESSIRTFLYSLNRHAWLNELKRRDRSLQREEKFQKLQDQQTPDISHSIIDSEERKKIGSLLERIGKTCKKILLLFYYEERSMKEILEELDYENEQVVRNKKYKCLKQLEKLINENPQIKQTLKNLFHG